MPFSDFEVQEAFQPGATPMQNSRRYLGMVPHLEFHSLDTLLITKGNWCSIQHGRRYLYHRLAFSSQR